MNIDRKNFLLLTGASIVNFFVSGCTNNVDATLNENSIIGVCYNGKVAIIIPEEYLNIDIYYDDYHKQIPAFDGNMAFFKTYDQAIEFAYKITGENGILYEYDGSFVTDDFNFTGVCYNGDVAVIIPEEYLNIDIYYDDYHKVISAFDGNFALFNNYDQASLFANEIVGMNGRVYDYGDNMNMETSSKLYKK